MLQGAHTPLSSYWPAILSLPTLLEANAHRARWCDRHLRSTSPSAQKTLLSKSTIRHRIRIHTPSHPTSMTLSRVMEFFDIIQIGRAREGSFRNHLHWRRPIRQRRAADEEVQEARHLGVGISTYTCAIPPPVRRRGRRDADTERLLDHLFEAFIVDGVGVRWDVRRGARGWGAVGE